MNKSERFRILLTRGYFPEELPPPLHTDDFGRYRQYVSRSWDAVGSDYPSSTAEVYSVPRIRQFRRSLSIVNPIAQLYLSQIIAEHWVEIRRHLRKSRYSADIPEIEDDKDRAVAAPDFALLTLRRIEISAAFDHALVSDISRFYGTLYTHAIPWALHGKEWCKRNLNSRPYRQKLGAQLDVAVRKGQDNQTIGIPIGPDTSRILSEIIGASIDEHVQAQLKLDRSRAFRYVDDWYIGFDNAGQAEDAISTIATGCRIFELELNAEKTRTLHASSGIDDIWATELREHRFRGGTVTQARSLEHYFMKAFNFANTNPDQNILDYAIKRTGSIVVMKENWRIYESFLLKAARANATVMPIVVQILVSYNYNQYTLGRERIAAFIEDVINKKAPLGYHSEVAWALFLAKGLRLSISAKAARAISELENSVTALVALDLQRSGLIQGILDTELWRISMTPSGLRSHMWLFAYEADLKGWLKGTPENFVNEDRHFSVLKQRGVSFYDTRRNVKHIKRRQPRKPSTSLLEFLKEMNMALPPSNIFPVSTSTYG
jgi:hypothetical protein